MSTITTTTIESQLAQRRNARPLPFLQTSFDDAHSRGPTPKSPVIEPIGPTKPSARITSPSNVWTLPSFLLAPHPTPRQPIDSRKTTKLSSKSSLFHLFHKPNVERARGNAEQGVAIPPSNVSERSRSRDASKKENSRSASRMSHKRRSIKIQKPNTEHDSTAYATFGKDVSHFSPASEASAEIDTGQALRAPSKQPWSPPPLSQAYSQSVMHAMLAHTEHCMRTSSRGPRKTGDHNVSSRPGTGSRKPSSRKPSNASLFNADSPHNHGPRKMFVLTTFGHLLQYAGDGSFDRLPEKIMKLGPKSAAFASDAIPGKHWVLQVIQSHGEDNCSMSITPKKSMFTRLMGSGFAARRTWVRNMLLVFDCPAQMNSWMVALREHIAEIEGANTRPETLRKQMRSAKEFQEHAPVPRYPITLTTTLSQHSLTLPTSPPTEGLSLPTSPTCTEGGRFSSATTAVGEVTHTGPYRHQPPGKTIAELQSMLSAAIPEQHSLDETLEGLRSSPRLPTSASDSGISPKQHSPLLSDRMDSEKRGAESAGPAEDNTRTLSVPSSAQSPAQSFFTPASTPMHQYFRRVPTTENLQSIDPVEECASASKGAARYSLYPATAGSTDATFIAPLRRSPTRTRKPGDATPKSSPPPSPGRTPLTDAPPVPPLDKDSLQRSLRDAPDLPPTSPIGNAFAIQDLGKMAADFSPPREVAEDPGDHTARASFLQPLRLSSIPERRSQRFSVVRGNAPLPLRTASNLDLSEPSESTWPLAGPTIGEAVADNDPSVSAPIEFVPFPRASPAIYYSREAALQSLLGQPSPALLDSPTIPYHTPPRSAPNTPDPSRPLRRPDSLRIKTDTAPFLSTSRTNSSTNLLNLSSGPTSPTSNKFSNSPYSAGSYGISSASAATSATSVSVATPATRQSTLVPCFRPPSVQRPGRTSRFSGGAGLKGGNARVGNGVGAGSPPSAPPCAPLPMPPVGSGVGIGV